jgi:excisionase family DNA binding protein
MVIGESQPSVLGSLPLTLTIKEAKGIATCSETTLYLEIAHGKLKAHKLGRKTIIFRDDLIAWLSALPLKTGKSESHKNAVRKRWRAKKQNS